ncbi:MAG: hypothetical protein WC494_03610 [Candidatus Pacearchaeota archaeon]
MKELKILEKKLKKVGGDIILGCTPGYDSFFEEFDKNLRRINIFFNLENITLAKIQKTEEIIEEVFKEYNKIYSIPKERANEIWRGELKTNKNILININIISMTSTKNIWDACKLLKKKVICGKDFTSYFVKRNYDWKEYYSLVDNRNNFINYGYFNENIPEKIRIGMLKSSFFQFIAGVLYCKGKIGSNRKEFVEFFREKLHDKKIIKIIGKFYENKYKSIEKATEDVIYFSNKLDKWKGVGSL